MLGSLLVRSLPRCKRLKSVLCVGCAALCISFTAVFISDCSAQCALVMQHLISQRAVCEIAEWYLDISGRSVSSMWGSNGGRWVGEVSLKTFRQSYAIKAHASSITSSTRQTRPVVLVTKLPQNVISIVPCCFFGHVLKPPTVSDVHFVLRVDLSD